MASTTPGGTPGTGEIGPILKDWMTTNGVTDLAGDKDGDGSTELIEFALATDPNDPASGLTSTTYLPTIQTFDVDGNGPADYLTLAIRLRDDLDGVIARIEFSTDLDTWLSDTDHVVLASSIANGDGTSTHLYRTASPIADNTTTAYLRLFLQMP